MSNPFDALSPKVPMEEAASYFLRLKTAGKMTLEDDKLYAECVKVAACGVGIPSIQRPKQPVPGPGSAAKGTKMAAAVAAFRKVAEDSASEEIDQASSMVAPGAPARTGADSYLAAEAAGREAEEQNASQYYAERFRETAQQMGALQQQSTESGQALAGAQEQIAGHGDQLQAAQQEGQLAQQAALQQVQTANAAATEAMQNAFEAERRVLEAKREAVQRQGAMQQFAQQLLDLADQAAATAQPVMPSSEAAAAGATPAAGMGGPEQPGVADSGANVEGEPPGSGGAPAPAATTGQEGGSAQASPNSPTPNAGGTAPGDATPQAKGDGEPSAPEQDPSAKRTGGVHIKVGSHPALIGGLLGGMAGAGVAGLEASGHGPDLSNLRERISEGEGRMEEPGMKGFAAAFNVAKDKAMLTLGEATQKHPMLATLTGGLVGAGLGASSGPSIAKGVQEAASNYRG